MRLSTSYRQILSISAPIMVGSAAQNIIALTDSVFLYYLSEDDFASIGFVSVFYLIIAAIGFGFSRGGQILIARRVGSGDDTEVGRTFYSLLYFELALAVIMFLVMEFGSYYLFAVIVDSDVVFYKSLEYLSTRQYGVFFAYTGVVFIALYTGIARPVFLIIDTIILAVFNIVLDYALIFGHWGLPAMGIAGAGLASTLAEAVALGTFLIYFLVDKKIRRFHIFHLPKFDLPLIKLQFKLGTPIVLQALVGLGSWFVFFGIVENLGERELAVTNLVRMVYLILAIPGWGFAAGVNTLVSAFIGNRKRMAVIPILWKTGHLCAFITMLLAIPVALFPQELLYPVLGSERADLVEDARPIFYILLGILGGFAYSSVLFNGLAGVGATAYGLKIQFFCAVVYIVLIYIVVEYTSGGLPWAWAVEIVYWLLIAALSMRYLYSGRWWKLRM